MEGYEVETGKGKDRFERTQIRDPWFGHVWSAQIEVAWLLTWSGEVVDGSRSPKHENDTTTSSITDTPEASCKIRIIKTTRCSQRQRWSQDLRHPLLCLETSHFHQTGDTRILVPDKAKISTVTIIIVLQDRSDDLPRPTRRTTDWGSVNLE